MRAYVRVSSSVPSSPGAFRGTSRFEVLGELGAGGMGIVYEVWDRVLERRFACKTLKQYSPDALLRFKHEFRSLQGLSHPNLVALGELFEDQGQWFFTMELVLGSGWHEHVLPQAAPAPLATQSMAPSPEVLGLGPTTPTPPRDLAAALYATQLAPGAAIGTCATLPIPVTTTDSVRLRDAVAQLARGLRALHAAGKVHRDVKPSNIRVTPEGRVVVLDFGLVTDADSAHIEAAGTVAYMAPEQAAGKAVGPAVDWYSVGVLLYEALTGSLPFRGTFSEVIRGKRLGLVLAPSMMRSGVDPELEQLCLALLRADPAQRPDAGAVLERLGQRVRGERGQPQPGRAPAPGATADRSFVGRQHELDALQAAFVATRDRAVTQLVLGESGLGKSALVREFLAQIEPHALVVSGRCSPRETVPFQAFDGAMDGLARHLRTLPPDDRAQLLPVRASELARVFPAFALVAPESTGTPAEYSQRAALFSAVRDLVTALAKRRPLVLALDDLQWADNDSRALLGDLLREPGPPGLLVLATVRTEKDGLATPNHPAEGLPGTVRRLFLDGLATNDAEQLAAALLAQAGASAEVDARALAQRSSGHPLFLAESVRQAVAGESKGGPEAGGLDAALHGRTRRLAPRLLRVLELVAVSPAPVDSDTLARAAASDRASCDAAIAELRLLHLVRAALLASGDAIEPFHDRVREVVLAHIGPRRAMAHHALARALEAGAQRPAEDLALHWEAAGEPARAFPYALTAAEHADRALAFDHAAGWWQRCLDLAPADPDERRRLAARMAEALGSAGRGEQAARAYLLAAEGLPEAAALEWWRRAAEELLHSGRVDASQDLFRRVLAAVNVRYPRTPGLAALGVVWLAKRRRFEAERRRTHAIKPEVAARIDALDAVASGLGYIDNVRGAYLRLLAADLAIRTGDPRRTAQALALAIPTISGMGPKGGVRACHMVARAQTLAAQTGDPHSEGMVAYAAAFGAAVQQGRWRSARRLCERAERIFRERCPRQRWELSTTRVTLVWCHAYLGELETLAELAPLRIREAVARGDLFAAAYLRTGEPNLVWLVRDDVARAHEEVRLALADWSSQGFFAQHCFALLAETRTDLYAGATTAGLERMDAAWKDLAGSMFMRNLLVRITMTHLRGAAAISAAMASGNKVVLRRAERDMRALRKERTRWGDALALLLQGGIAHARGDRVAAAAAYAAAELALEDMDMALHAACARYRRGQLTGGDDRDYVLGSAEAWLRAQRVVAPERLVSAIVPG
jgi:hypothetical protein